MNSAAKVLDKNLMHPIRWVLPHAGSLLDIGCNAGELLRDCRQAFPAMRLAGVDVNPSAIERARQNVPDSDLFVAGAQALPFPDDAFDCVTCVEVLEHIPADLRWQSLKEIGRVLRPDGRLVLRVPHAGLFDFLDSNNFRFRLPGLYGRVVGQGRRDLGYENGSKDIVWHHHFKKDELLNLLGFGWEMQACRRGGLFLMPLMDIACWPFYRTKRLNGTLYRALHQLMDFDMGFDYGSASFDLLLVLRRS
jgi:SAM-dependent methyltransferase